MVDLSKKCPTGIPGLDDLIDGGFPRSRSMLVSGTCGTGKTTFGIQFLYNGILQYNEPGILLALEQDSNEIRQDMLNFGFDLRKLEDEGKLIVIDTSLSKIGVKDLITTLPVVPQKSFSLLPGEFEMEKVIGLAIQAAKRIKAKRIVIDSLPALDILVKEEAIRRTIVNISCELKANGLTALLITESLEDDGITKHGVEEYVTDGVILLRTNEALDTRTIKIRKMRTTSHSLKPATIVFTNRGVEVHAPKKQV